jgi:glycosyltransferase involved in cell wall biosynthesis
MENTQTIKILFFPDRIGGEASGARSARATLKTLTQLGYEVALFTADAEQIINYPEFIDISYYKIDSLMRADTHFYEPTLVSQFKKILIDFKPDYFFMKGGIQKPAILAKIARKNDVKNIFIFYITDYYCAKVYAGLENGPCFKCIEVNSFQALTNGCVKGNLKIPNFLKGMLVRKKLQNEILKAHKVVGYSEDQLNIYKKIGVEESKCQKVSLQFDPDELKDYPNSDGDYFLILGQPIIEKGFHVIYKILENCKSTPKIRIIFKDLKEEQKALNDFNLLDLVASGMITTTVGLDDRLDIIKTIANAKAIIIPSYYPTTGEFVFIESLLLEKPILVFNVGAHKNFITHRLSGMVADVGDFETFSKNIDEINGNQELRMLLSKGGKKFIMDTLSDENRLKSMSQLFTN